MLTHLNRLPALVHATRPSVSIGTGGKVSFLARLSTRHGGRIKIGKRVEILPGAILATYGGDIVIGDDCSINPYCVVYGHGGLTIGNGVRIAAHTVIIPANHRFDHIEKPIRFQEETKVGIRIEDDVWIAAGARILDGVRIARGCVIAAGAVVARSTEPNGIYGGIPARRLKDRGAEEN